MSNGYYLVFDVGGTEIKCNAFDRSGQPRFTNTSYPAYSDGSKEEIIAHLLRIINETAGRIEEPKTILGIGFAFPGPFDYENGICLIWGLGKYEGLYGVNLKKILSGKLKVPVLFECDAFLFALGESRFGAGQGFERIACFTLGTGCGSAFIRCGKIVKGEDGIPESGMIYDQPFRDSVIDDYVSARGLKKIAAQYCGREMSGKELYERAKDGDACAANALKEFGRTVSDALGGCIRAFGTERIILGGQISKSFPYFKAGFSGLSEKMVKIAEDTSLSTMRGIFTLFH